MNEEKLAQSRKVNWLAIAAGIIVGIAGVVLGSFIGYQLTDTNTATIVAAFVNVIGLLVGVASLSLAIAAIVISFHIKRETDAVNRDTQKLLMDIGTSAKVISDYAMPEFKEGSAFQRRLVEQAVERLTKGGQLTEVEQRKVNEEFVSSLVQLMTEQQQAEVIRKKEELHQEKDTRND